jgi:predicted Zn-dependent protease with MMP-like domain
MLLGGAPVRAQQMGRTLTGTVTDRQHEPLAGAIVQVHSENTLTVISYIADREGHYVFKHLSPEDDYDVFATYRGVRSNARRLSKFDSKPDREFHLVVRLH